LRRRRESSESGDPSGGLIGGVSGWGGGDGVGELRETEFGGEMLGGEERVVDVYGLIWGVRRWRGVARQQRRGPIRRVDRT